MPASGGPNDPGLAERWPHFAPKRAEKRAVFCFVKGGLSWRSQICFQVQVIRKDFGHLGSPFQRIPNRSLMDTQGLKGSGLFSLDFHQLQLLRSTGVDVPFRGAPRDEVADLKGATLGTAPHGEVHRPLRTKEKATTGHLRWRQSLCVQPEHVEILCFVLASLCLQVSKTPSLWMLN